MNIFVLDHNPIIAAQYAYDTHTIGMCKENMQILCTNARLMGFDHPAMIKSTHPNHPSTAWSRASSQNMAWHMAYTESLFAQYTKRYGKHHAYQNIYNELLPLFDACCDELESQGKIELTPFALAMPEHCMRACPVESYRTYYKHKAQQEIDRLAVYNVLVKRGCKPRKPALRFVWQRAERPTWATYETAQHEK